jgi:hypothetical protein
MWHEEFPESEGAAMKNKLLHKGFILFGLFLFFSVLVPFLPSSVATAMADTGKDKIEACRLNVSYLVLAKDTTFPLKTYNLSEDAKISFKSDDEEIASINGDGLISAKKVGTTVITATIKQGSDSTPLTCDLTVGPAAISVKWTQSIVILSLDSTETLNVILKPSNTVEDAKLTSLNSDIVSVTPGGRASAKSYGYAELRAYIKNSGSPRYDACGVIVTSAENVSKLEDYFSEHTELDQILKEDLCSALDQFFNKEFDQTSSSNLITNLDRYLNDTFTFTKSK